MLLLCGARFGRVSRAISRPEDSLQSNAPLTGMRGALRRLYKTLFTLSTTLSPDWVPSSPWEAIPWARLCVALCACQAGLLACAVRMLLSSRIVWGRTEYSRHKGGVSVVRRQPWLTTTIRTQQR